MACTSGVKIDKRGTQQLVCYLMDGMQLHVKFSHVKGRTSRYTNLLPIVISEIDLRNLLAEQPGYDFYVLIITFTSGLAMAWYNISEVSPDDSILLI